MAIAEFLEHHKQTAGEKRALRAQATGSQAGRSSFSLESIRGMIDTRLQVEAADRTGKVDHAALYNGARIVSQTLL